MKYLILAIAVLLFSLQVAFFWVRPPDQNAPKLKLIDASELTPKYVCPMMWNIKTGLYSGWLVENQFFFDNEPLSASHCIPLEVHKPLPKVTN